MTGDDGTRGEAGPDDELRSGLAADRMDAEALAATERATTPPDSEPTDDPARPQA